MYLRYFMVNPFRPAERFVVAIRRGGRRFSFLVSSEAPTHLNSDRGEKLREDEWLISAILREINHLGGNARTGEPVFAYNHLTGGCLRTPGYPLPLFFVKSCFKRTYLQSPDNKAVRAQCSGRGH